MIEERLEQLIAFKTTSNNKDEIQRCFDWITSELSSLPLHIKKIENNTVAATQFPPTLDSFSRQQLDKLF